MHGRLLPIAVILAVWLLSSCGRAEPSVPCEDDARCLSYAITADIPILDPHIAELPEAGMIFRQIYDTLVYRDNNTHEFVPGLAQSWAISSDGLQYTFNLRQDITFHDGTPFNAEAVARNIDRIFDPAINSTRARSLLGPFSHYEIADAYTIHLRLAIPFAPFLDGLAQPFLGIMSPQALSEFDSLRYQFHQVGTGPFRLEKYLPGERTELRRNLAFATNPAIYRPLAGGEIDRVVFHVLDGDPGESHPLLSGSIDVIDDLAPGDAVDLVANSRLQLLPIPIPGQSAQFMFNTEREHISRQDVRRALLYATNRHEISNEIFFNYSPVAWAPLSVSTGYAHTGYIGEFSHDLGLAQELLALAGYIDDDGDGFLEREDQTLSLSILIPPWDEWPAIAAYLREQWRRIGVRVTVEPVPGGARLINGIRSGEHDLIAIDNYGVDPAILGNVFFENTIYGESRGDNPQLGDLLVAAVQEQDPRARRTLYYDIQVLLMTESLILPIRDNVRLRAARSYVTGLTYDRYGFYPLLHNVQLRDN